MPGRPESCSSFDSFFFSFFAFVVCHQLGRCNFYSPRAHGLESLHTFTDCFTHTLDNQHATHSLIRSFHHKKSTSRKETSLHLQQHPGRPALFESRRCMSRFERTLQIEMAASQSAR
ncbi:unnamed protein product [Mortierella alpina]